MHELEPFSVFTAPIEKIGLEYMVTGSIASIVYGEPRMTHDIDILEVSADSLDREELTRWIERLDLQDVWKQAKTHDD